MTLYAIRPEPGTESLDDAEVVDQLRYGWQFLEQAVTLSRLVDNGRADEMQAIIDRATAAAGDGELRFYRADLEELLLRLLAGIENAIVEAGIVDQHWRVPAERLEDLAKQVPAMDLTTDRPIHSKMNALAEVMMNAIFLRNFLSDAAKNGCIVALG
jgi:ATP phosphoribosyltransferase